MGTPAGPEAELETPLTELPGSEPFPDRWLPPSTAASPEARYEQRESVELAFVAAVAAPAAPAAGRAASA